jgi:hypothetical protein
VLSHTYTPYARRSVRGVRGLLGDTAPTPQEEAAFPGYLTIGQRLQINEATVWGAYAKILALQATGAPLDSSVIDAYMTTRQALIDAGSSYMDAATKYAAQQGQAAPAPYYPPSISAATAATSGLGKLITGNQLLVTFGPVGDQKTVPLNDPQASAPLQDRALQMQAIAGLGIDFGLIALVLFSVALLVGALYLLIHEINAPEAQRLQLATHQSDLQTQMLSQVSTSYTATYTDCVQKGGTPDKCADNAASAVAAIRAGVPSPVPVQGSGLGLFGTIGLFAALGLVGFLGVIVIQRVRRGDER